VVDRIGDYSILRTALDYGYFRLNVFEFVYPFVVSLGPMLLVVALCCLFTSFRRELISRFRSNVLDHDVVLVLISVITVFSVFGGSDAERFVMWGWPFFALAGLHGLQVLWSHRPRMFAPLLLIALASLAWTRFYVPAFPHVFFPGESYCSWAGVKTNYDPDLYRGIPGLSPFREGLIDVPAQDIFVEDEIVLNRNLIGQAPKVPAAHNRDSCAELSVPVFRGAYRFNINHLPIPLGIPHNHF
jgi:hypothetical protein